MRGYDPTGERLLGSITLMLSAIVLVQCTHDILLGTSTFWAVINTGGFVLASVAGFCGFLGTQA